MSYEDQVDEFLNSGDPDPVPIPGSTGHEIRMMRESLDMLGTMIVKALVVLAKQREMAAGCMIKYDTVAEIEEVEQMLDDFWPEDDL